MQARVLIFAAIGSKDTGVLALSCRLVVYL
jgi:hypothetical protein